MGYPYPYVCFCAFLGPYDFKRYLVGGSLRVRGFGVSGLVQDSGLWGAYGL